MIRNRANLLLMLADTIPLNPRYKTLYYGLKINHPRNAAVVHPLMFMLRRVILAAVIVLMSNAPLAASNLFMFTTIVMLAYTLSEKQWNQKFLNS